VTDGNGVRTGNLFVRRIIARDGSDFGFSIFDFLFETELMRFKRFRVSSVEAAIFFLITTGLPAVLAWQPGFKKGERTATIQKSELISKKIFFMICLPELNFTCKYFLTKVFREIVESGRKKVTF
jgi:hypothetical protein